LKKIFTLIAIITMVSSAGFADILATAPGIGEGNMAIQGFYASSSVAGTGISQFGPKVIYGVSKDFDVSAKLGIGSYSGVSANTIGVGGKYTFLVGDKKGVDIAGFVNYETASITGVTLSQLAFGGLFSKEIKKDISLYGILGMTQVSYEYKWAGGKFSASSTALTFGGGVKAKINKDVAVLGEFTTFAADGSAYSTFALAGQFSI
jgi:hypothetical protein